jgi:hypothetical protein
MRIRRAQALPLTGGVLGVILAAGAAAIVPASPSIKLSTALPAVVRQKQHVRVRGHIRGAPRHTRAALEAMALHGSWKLVATAPIRAHRAFSLSWRVARSHPTGPLSLRVAALQHGVVLAHSPAVKSFIGPAAVPCAPPVPPGILIPPGDGWIQGGRYIIGGPFPGLDECDSESYTETATDSQGLVAATETLAGGHSYTLVVPAGSYTLTSGSCRGTATVKAGQRIKADTNCDVP